ncbi:hypothetical protein BH24CHL6_BH24CHL6_11230 [soil metagenome]
MNGVEDMLSVLRRLNPDGLVEVTIERNGDELTREAELAQRPQPISAGTAAHRARRRPR